MQDVWNEDVDEDKNIKKIEKDVYHLLESMQTLHEQVEDSQDVIDTIEDFIEQSKMDIKEGTKNIEDGSIYNNYYTYIYSISIGSMGVLAFLLFG